MQKNTTKIISLTIQTSRPFITSASSKSRPRFYIYTTKSNINAILSLQINSLLHCCLQLNRIWSNQHRQVTPALIENTSFALQPFIKNTQIFWQEQNIVNQPTIITCSNHQTTIPLESDTFPFHLCFFPKLAVFHCWLILHGYNKEKSFSRPKINTQIPPPTIPQHIPTYTFTVIIIIISVSSGAFTQSHATLSSTSTIPLKIIVLTPYYIINTATPTHPTNQVSTHSTQLCYLTGSLHYSSQIPTRLTKIYPNCTLSLQIGCMQTLL